MMKDKIAGIPILKHFYPELPPVIVVYASKWAVSAVLLQDHDGVHRPVIFTSRTLKPNEIDYDMVETEVLAFLRILCLGYTMLVGREIKVLSCHFTMAWLLKLPKLNGRSGRWAALLSNWTLEIVIRKKKILLKTLATSVTPREEVDEVLIAISHKKKARQTISMPTPTVRKDKRLLVFSFDGSARLKK